MTESAVSELQPRNGTLARLVARLAYVLLLVGTGAVAAHLLDDSFVQPEAGTSAGDHLISGLVPTLAVLAAAWAYPRLRAGARAMLALSLGAFGVVAGASEAGYHVVKAGTSGDDYTGLLALLGGLLILVLGLAELWKTRRLDESLRRRYLRRSLIGVAAAIVFFEIAFPILFAYVYTHAGRSFAPEARLGIGYEDVTFRTSDGLADARAPRIRRPHVRSARDRRERG